MKITPKATIISREVSHSSFTKNNRYEEYGHYTIKCPKCGEVITQISFHREGIVETCLEKFCPYCGTKVVCDDDEEDDEEEK